MEALQHWIPFKKNDLHTRALNPCQYYSLCELTWNFFPCGKGHYNYLLAMCIFFPSVTLKLTYVAWRLLDGTPLKPYKKKFRNLSIYINLETFEVGHTLANGNVWNGWAVCNRVTWNSHVEINEHVWHGPDTCNREMWNSHVEING